MSGPKRIFIVDDDRDLAESLAEVLESRGHEVTLAHSGEEAVSIFRERDFDITFADVKLPGMNGVESFFEIRKLRPDAKVMLMTGYSIEKLLEQAVAQGALGVLRKPFAMTEILEAVERIEPAGMVLVADDDPDFADSAVSLLSAGGYRAAVARTGDEAVARVTQGGITCLVLDLRLPVLDGLEVFLELRRRGRPVPTLMVTGCNAEDGRVTMLRSMAAGFLAKPFDPRALLAAIDRLAA